LYRIEIWTKFSNENEDSGKNMKKYIDEKIVSIIKECNDPMVNVSQIKFTQHKTQSSTGGGNKGYQNKYPK